MRPEYMNIYASAVDYRALLASVEENSHLK